MSDNTTTSLDMSLPGSRWLGRSSLLNLGDDRLRLRAKSLVQLANSDRERVLAVYEFVKSMPFCAPHPLGYRTARQVLDARKGDGWDKSTLFVALLRSVYIPSRIHFIEVSGDVLKGFVSGAPAVQHPIVQVWLGGRWVQTDAHIHDIHYVVHARAKLNAAQWDMGYGIHRNAHSVWNAQDDAFAAFDPEHRGSLALKDLGVFDDPRRFSRAMVAQSPSLSLFKHLGEALTQAVHLFRISRGVFRLRNEIAAGQPKASSAPMRISPR